jgi:hypothetical protein
MSNRLLADSNRASLREAVEDVNNWGVTPTTGVTRAIRFTSSSISVKKDTAVSNEIRDDRMVSSVIETAASSGGEINFEFSAGNQDSFLERALMSYFTRPMTFDFFRGQNVSVTDATHVRIAGVDVTAYFTVGRRLKLSGFVLPANNAFVQIAAIAFTAGNTDLTITGPALVAEAVRPTPVLPTRTTFSFSTRRLMPLRHGWRSGSSTPTAEMASLRSVRLVNSTVRPDHPRRRSRLRERDDHARFGCGG